VAGNGNSNSDGARPVHLIITMIKWIRTSKEVSLWQDEANGSPRVVTPCDQRLVFYCRTASASTAPCTSRRMCYPTHCANYCAPCQPLLRAFSGWVRSPPPTCLLMKVAVGGRTSSSSIHKVYEPYIRALLGTASHFSKVVVLRLKTVAVGGRTRRTGRRFHPSGWLRAGVLTCRLISLVGVKWSCLRINKQAFPPGWQDEANGSPRVVTPCDHVFHQV